MFPFKRLLTLTILLVLVAHCQAMPSRAERRQHLQPTRVFMRAAYNGNLRKMRALLSEGANAAAIDENGENALVWAANGGQARSVDFLLSHGVSAKDRNGAEALFTAVDEGQESIIKSLLNHGANANARDKARDNATPLMIACFYDTGEDNVFGQSADIVKLLLLHNADVNARDNAGKTALMYLKNKPNTEIHKMLLNAGAKN